LKLNTSDETAGDIIKPPDKPVFAKATAGRPKGFRIKNINPQDMSYPSDKPVGFRIENLHINRPDKPVRELLTPRINLGDVINPPDKPVGRH